MPGLGRSARKYTWTWQRVIRQPLFGSLLARLVATVTNHEPLISRLVVCVRRCRSQHRGGHISSWMVCKGRAPAYARPSVFLGEGACISFWRWRFVCRRSGRCPASFNRRLTKLWCVLHFGLCPGNALERICPTRCRNHCVARYAPLALALPCCSIFRWVVGL